MKQYRKLNTIQALTFDLDDTLYDNHPVITKVEQNMVAWMHQYHPVSSSWTWQQWQALKSNLAQQYPQLAHDVTLLRQTQIEQGLKLLGYDDLKAKSAAKQGIEQALWWRNQIEVPQLAHDVLNQLAQVFPLVAITNGNADPHQIGLSQYFCHTFRAGPDGHAKPEPDMFIRAQKALNLASQNILHVGDHPVSDVQGAKLAGYQACWFNDSERQIHTIPTMLTLPDLEITCLSDLLKLIS